MNRGRRLARWCALGTTAALLTVLVGASGASGGTGAASRRAYTGATTVSAGDLFAVVVTNLGPTSIRPTVAIFDQDGTLLKKQRPTIAEGASAMVKLLVGTDGGVWRARVSNITDGTSNTLIGFLTTDPDGPTYIHGGIGDPASTVRLGVVRVAPPDGLRVLVANVGSATTSADVDLYDLSGQLVRSETLTGIAPGSTAEVSFNFCCIAAVRAVVTGPSGSQLIGTAELFDGSGRTVALMEEEGIFF